MTTMMTMMRNIGDSVSLSLYFVFVRKGRSKIVNKKKYLAIKTSQKSENCLFQELKAHSMYLH